MDSGSPIVALAAAHDLHQIGLTDALELCLGDPPRYSRAVTRWHSRYAAEERGVSGPESAAVLALLLALLLAIAGPRPKPAAQALAELLGETGLRQASEVLIRWARSLDEREPLGP